MNKEEAIERLKYIDMAYNCNNYYSKYDLDCIETVLQLLKEQDNKINKMRDYLRDMIKEERDFIKDLEYKNVAFHYANGRETLSKEILGILEE